MTRNEKNPFAHMNCFFRRQTVAVLLLPLISISLLSSCTSTRLKNAATTQGQIQARINLPEYPTDCRAKEQHAAIKVGDEVRSVLKRERAALDRQNTRTDRCSEFWDTTASKLAGK